MNDLDAEFAQLAAPTQAPAAAPQSAPSLDAEFAALSGSSGEPPRGKGTAPPSLGLKDWLAAGPEAVARVGSGTLATIGGGLAGLADMPLYAAGISGRSPADVVRGVQNQFTYEPRTQGGQGVSRAIEYLPGKLAQGANWAGEKTTDITGSPLLGTAVNTGIQALPLLAGSKYLTPAEKPLAAPQLAPGVSEATQAGLKLTPEQAQSGIIGRVAQGISGSAKLERNLSKSNATTVDRGAAQQIGAPDLSPASIAAAKIPHNAVYEAASSAGSVALKPTDFSSVRMGGTLKNAEVEALREHYSNMGNIDAADLVADVRQLRASANKNIKAPFAPAQNSLGYAQKAAADGLDKALDRHLGSLGDQAPVAPGELQNARRSLAQIHSVEDAMDGDHLSAAELAKQQERGVPLTGNLKTYADAHTRFNRSLQDVSKIRDSVPVNFADLLLGGAAGFAHHFLAPAMFARPAMRGVLSSPLYQRSAIAGAPLMGEPSFPGLMGTAPAMPLLEGGQRRSLLE